MNKKEEKIAYFRGKLHNLSETMAKIDALFTKSLTFLILILNFPSPCPLLGLPEKYTPMRISLTRFSGCYSLKILEPQKWSQR